MSNVTVTVNQANITVDEANSNVAVTTTTSNVTVATLPIISNAIIRASLSVTDTGGDGSLAYDQSSGVFTYTGPSASEVRSHFSATSPMQLSSGVISIDSNALFTGKTTDDLTEGSTNLYFTNARADTRVNLQTGNNLDLSYKSTSDLSEGTNLYYTTARANSAITDFDGALTPSSLTAAGNVEGVTLKGTGALGLVVNGNATIGGNLDVTGNINSETVVDLFVEDRNITMQYGSTGTPSANSQIFIDRGDESNTYIKWDESSDKWKFSNDGSTEYLIPSSTSDLAEGTNLYYTDSRFDTRFATKDTDDLTQGTTNKYYATSLFNTDFATKTTSDLTEGTNLYYTTARANSAIGAYTGTISPNNVLVTEKSITLNSQNTTPGDITFNVDFDNVDITTNVEIISYDNIESTVGGLAVNFNNDGTKMYLTGELSASPDKGIVNEYSLSTPYDVSTSSYTANVVVTSQVNEVSGITFNADGTKMYLCGILPQTGSPPYNTGAMFQYSLGTAFDVTTATYDNATYNPGFLVPEDVKFNSDGTRFWLLNSLGDEMQQIDISVANAGNISFGVGGGTFDVGTENSQPTGFDISTDGTKLLVADMSTGNVHQYSMSSAFDVTTASYDSKLFDGNEGSNLRNMALVGDSKMFLVDNSNVYQYSYGNDPYIKWNNTAEDWEIYDGTTVFKVPTSTTDLAEGTNLYYTDARAQAALSVTTTAASGDGALAYDNTSGVFTFTPADSEASEYGDSNVVSLLSAFGSNTITTTGNISTGGLAVEGTAAGNIITVKGSHDTIINGANIGTRYIYKSGDDNSNFVIHGQSNANISGGTSVLELRRDGGTGPGKITLGNSAFGTGEIEMTGGNATSNTLVTVGTSFGVTTGFGTSPFNVSGGHAGANASAKGSVDLGGPTTLGKRLATGFDANILIGGTGSQNEIDTAGALKLGWLYTITTTGTTDFTLIGAADSNPGTTFRPTGVGSGTGTATRSVYNSGNVIFGGDAVTGNLNINSVISNEADFYQGGHGEFYWNGNVNLLHGENNAGGQSSGQYIGNLNIGDATSTAKFISDGSFSSNANITTTANISADTVLADHVISDSAQPLQLKGQTNGIEFDKTIATVESRIFDTDTTGYSLADADLGTANVTTASIPRILTAFYGIAGQSTLTCVGLAAASGIYTAFELAGGSFAYPNAYWNPSQGGTPGDSAQTSLENALTTSGTTLGGVAWAGLGNLSGWRVFDATAFSTTYLMGVTGHITGISGNTVSLSEPLLNNVAGPVILIPGAFSSTQNFGMVMTGDASTNALTFDYALSLYNQYDLPQTLSNVTVDRIAYGSDSTINLSNVVMRHIADVETGPDSAIKVPRSMLIGANVTPDLLSIGTNEALAATSTLGITIEQDGVTDFGPLETTPQMKLMLNNYKTNSLASFTEYPKWTEFLGQSGNATVDMPYLGAPNLNFKLLGGTKPAKAATSAGDIPGRITFNVLTGTGATGSDQFNPPASVTAMVGGTGDLTAMANTDMYFQSTSATSYRDGPYVGSGQGSTASGSIPQTFLASKSGTTVLAANQAGSISLRPVRDYADSGDASSYVDNRYADNLHEYHAFMDATWENPAGRTGSRVTINAKSGQTNGATPSGTDFNYDSKGNATLRFQTHNSDSSARYNFDLIHDEANEKFFIESGVSNQQHIEIESAGRVSMKQVMRLQPLTTTEINALVGPLAGDTVFNTTLALVCVYNGSAWRKLNDAAM